MRKKPKQGRLKDQMGELTELHEIEILDRTVVKVERKATIIVNVIYSPILYKLEKTAIK